MDHKPCWSITLCFDHSIDGRKRREAYDYKSRPSREIFSLEDMEAAITPKTKAIVCTNGSNLTGNYVDVCSCR